MRPPAGTSSPAPNARVPPALDRAAEPLRPRDVALAGDRLRLARQHPERPQHVLDAADEQLHRGLVEQTAAARLGDDRRDARLGGGDARHAAETRLDPWLPHDVRQPERLRQRAGALLHPRLGVDRERLERLEQIAAVQVDDHVRRGDQLREDRVGEDIAVGAGGIPGKAPVQVLAVLGRHEGRPAPEGREVDDRHGRDPPASRPGSSAPMNRVTAAIDEYSQPWTPPSSARCGPSSRPRASKAGCTNSESSGASKEILRRVTLGMPRTGV